MKRLAALLAAILAGCGPSLEDQARQVLSGELKDPDSALFKDLHQGAGGAICGQVSSRNSYGAYTGYAYFYSLQGITLIDSGERGTDAARSMCRGSA